MLLLLWRGPGQLVLTPGSCREWAAGAAAEEVATGAVELELKQEPELELEPPW